VKKNLIKFSFLILLFSLSTSYSYAQPPNALLTNAAEVTISPFTDSVSVIESDNAEGGIYDETSEDFCDGFNISNWWYKITVSSAGTLTASAMATGATNPPSNAESAGVCIYVDSGSGFPLGARLAGQSSFDGSNTVNPTASTAVTPGTYYISVGNSATFTAPGPFVTTITFDGAFTAPASVPTLSEWGLIILALLLVTFGTLYLIRANRMEFGVEHKN